MNSSVSRSPRERARVKTLGGSPRSLRSLIPRVSISDIGRATRRSSFSAILLVTERREEQHEKRSQVRKSLPTFPGSPLFAACTPVELCGVWGGRTLPERRQGVDNLDAKVIGWAFRRRVPFSSNEDYATIQRSFVRLMRRSIVRRDALLSTFSGVLRWLQS